MMRRMKRVLTILLTWVLLVSMIPDAVFAKGSDDAAAEQMESVDEVPDIEAQETQEILTQDDLASCGYLVPSTEETNEKEGSISRGQSIDQGISNRYVEVNIGDNGRFTIGNVEGIPQYTSDDNEILLYGHPGGKTSKTLIKVDDNEMFFEADAVDITTDKIYAYMTVSEFGVQIIQTLEFVRGDAGLDNMVKISYKAINTSSTSRNVGIRIMLDTMLASNDDAPFKISGYGNVTTRREFSGSAIPKTYQVYDDLDHPSTMATGIVYADGGKKPNRVQFTNWDNVTDAYWDYNHGEGGELGDSAVVLYYDPVSLNRGETFSVATFYGPSASAVLAGGSDLSVDSRHAGVRVKDRATGEGISGVSVTAYNKKVGRKVTETTNEAGLALFDEGMAGNCEITAYIEGYHQTIVTKELKKKKFCDITISTDDKVVPEIKGVTLDGKDILNGRVTYCENKDEVVPNASNSKVVKLKVTQATPGCLYRLIQNGKVVENSANGEFNLTVITKNANGKAYSIPRLKGFTAGSEL
ncbi:MAG: carboxypeptidase-like regulatory domain-containing protein [Lachnospiraceae bacterium]|nr:carboxypeptidase-like regulatory domain-containing protein [Lachnospiraceae bacterium]